jgi:S1-C subfamily serine protease
MAVSSQPGEGPFVLVRAVSEMSPGDEVTLDYLAPGVEGSLVQPERRQAALLQRWGFRCR